MNHTEAQIQYQAQNVLGHSSFSDALERLKAGHRLQRQGWNGKGMYVVLQQGYPDGIPINANTSRATGLPVGTVCRFSPYLTMYTAQGDFTPWLPSQADLLSEDWQVVAQLQNAQSTDPGVSIGQFS